MGADTARALAEAAHGLREAARVHKRAEAANRRQARELMELLSRLRAECERAGIRLVIQEGEGERRHHGQQHRDTAA